MRRLIYTLLILLVATPLLAIAAFLALFVEAAPLVPPQPAPSPEDVLATREFVHKVRAASNSNISNQPTVSLTIEEANSVIRFGARFLKGSRAIARIEGGKAVGEASVPLPWPLAGRWLNGSAVVAPFEPELNLEDIRVGRLSLPPEATIEVGRVAANFILGAERGDKLLRSSSAMRIEGDELIFTLQLDRVGRGSIMRGVFGALRGGGMPEAEEVDRYYAMIRQAIEEGSLNEQGSFLPYLKFALNAALDVGRGGDLPNEYTAAIFGLTKACGAREFTLIVGRLAGANVDDFGQWRRKCDAVTFNDRIDSRRHFITAAAIRAASNRGVAVSVGEYKELLDTISGAGGFDFTDIAANNSGIRMSDLPMASPAEDWPGLLARIEQENDVIVPFDGIPGRMSEEEFEARFIDVESVPYLEMLDRIEAKIDLVALHR